MATTETVPGCLDLPGAEISRLNKRKRKRMSLLVGTLAIVAAGGLFWGVYSALQEARDRAH